MRIFTAILLVVFLVSPLCFADVFVIYDSNTRAIYTVSEKDDTVVPIGYEKVVLPGELDDYIFIENPTFYDWQNNKFKLNTQRVDGKEKKKQDKKDKDEEWALIQQEMINYAVPILEGIGYTIKHYSVVDQTP